MSTTPRDTLAGAGTLVGLALALITFATLTPERPYGLLNPIATRPAAGIKGLIDLAGNVALFLPLGIALAARGARFTTAVGVGLGCSLAVETLQVIVPGRYPSLTDLVTNTLGNALGSLAYIWTPRPTAAVVQAVLAGLQHLIHPGRSLTPVLVAVATVLPAMGAAMGALLAIPISTAGSVQIAPTALDQTDRVYIGGALPGRSFCGAVDEVRIYTRALSAAEIASDRDHPTRDQRAAPGLVAAYSFDGPETLADDSGGQVPSRLDGAERISNGRFGAAIHLADGRARALVGPSVALRATTAVTLSAWVRPEKLECGPSVLESSEGTYFLHAGSRRDPLRPYGGARFVGNFEGTESAARIPVHRWSHLAFTYDGERLQLYVDAELQAVKIFAARALDHVEADGRAVHAGQPLPALPWPWTSRPLIVVLDGRELGTRSDRRPLLRLLTEDHREALAMEAVGTSLRLRYRSRFEVLGGAPVEYRLPDALPSDDATGPLRVDVSGARLQGQLRVGTGSAWSLGLTPAGWWTRLMHAQELPVLLQWLGTLITAAAMSFPLGYYTRGSRWGPTWVVAPLPALWGAAALVPMMFPTALELAFGAVGFVLGWGLRRNP